MWVRAIIGGAALGLYGWRVEDPKGSYAAFYDASDWLTGWLLAGDGAWGYARNFANLVLVDQADGFLLGMAFMALVSVVLWPVRAGGRWGLRRLRDAVTRRSPDEMRAPVSPLRQPPAPGPYDVATPHPARIGHADEEPLLLTDRIEPEGTVTTARRLADRRVGEEPLLLTDRIDPEGSASAGRRLVLRRRRQAGAP